MMSIPSITLKVCGCMSRFFKYDSNLKTFSERCDFVVNNLDEILRAENRDYANDYLLASQDIDDTDISYTANVKNLYKTTPEYKSYRRLHNSWLKSHSLIFTRDSFSYRDYSNDLDSVTENESISEDDRYNNVLFLFRASGIDKNTVKNILRHGKYIYTDDNVSKELFEQIDFIIKLAYETSKDNDKDIEVLDLFTKNLTMEEIADIMGVSKQAISKRIDKIVRNMGFDG